MRSAFRRARGVARGEFVGASARAPEAAAPPCRRLDTVICELAEVTTLDDIVGIVSRAARQLVGAAGATFVLREGEECYYADEDAIAPLWKGRRFPLSACVSGWAMLHRRQAIIADVYADARIPQDAYRPTFVRSLVMTPVGTVDPWAAIGVYWAERIAPTSQQAACLHALANSTSMAMENVRLRARLAGGTGPLVHFRPERVTMCAWTRRIEWQGTWLSVERYLEERFCLQVTHGISDEAARALEPQRPAPPDRGTP